MVVKTYRGNLADGAEDRIRLSTIKGKVGYRITKFEIIGSNPGSTENFQTVVQIWKTTQSSPSNAIDYTDSDLLAAGLYNFGTNGNGMNIVIIFDQEIFNQDIFISQSTANGSLAINYYFELEAIPLDDAGAEYTTLKDMRQA